ncbi:OmpA family protein [Flavobacteriaceae bacterium]|jgi:outer membrane protein OmpA-like peptidoglycan-associated protein|nr:OmpA family protein [Flavobacteriaceae bacterium]MDA7724047.1 OmpA family protein [Flavobacteriaceae bacterium]MDA7727581.1 OmpA family protein [Flavobacteriaceae bacterium]MDB0003852.1 OmpA family protein [Flavobacteriaceae bacterium]MDG1309347.1 OmpA family protein [Flavobacteriaceae bacterium]|tara:strand:+ start:16192 stop:17022 length:831 start_codon:yes stop_codon:yes gene_type:complete
MKKIVFLLFLLITVAQAQTGNTHVVYFETGQYEVPEIETNRLVLFIQSLKDIEIERIAIYGFCDDRGSDSYNLILSQDRANAIKKIFSGFGVDDNLISNVDGKGEVLLRVISSDNLNIIRGLNRKVEINVVYKITETKGVVKEEKEYRFLNDKLKVGDKITLENILFKTGYSYIVEESVPVLEMMADALRERDDIYFTIEGHVCCTKNARDAVDRKTGKRNLSLARAKYIYDYLVQKGVKRTRMRYVGLKNKYPLGKAMKYDKRVEIKITSISKRN